MSTVLEFAIVVVMATTIVPVAVAPILISS